MLAIFSKLDTKINDGADIRIIPSIAGGTDDLSAQELIRYSRQLSLPEVGLDGQKKIKKSKVLIVGAGGLGSPVALYLAAAGVGKLGLVDFDVVDESNLQRQVLFGMDQIGKPKLNAAKERLKKLNPYNDFQRVCIKITHSTTISDPREQHPCDILTNRYPPTHKIHKIYI